MILVDKMHKQNIFELSITKMSDITSEGQGIDFYATEKITRFHFIAALNG